MEVSKVIDRVTHAVVGGMEAESMGIADDPAFYHMLSSTLYSDERKAVIRETLCNAWDAHIEAGCTDKALEVTLNTDKLIIQDFGHGIARHLIKPIYGVYGASTKKSNANVTGGFGLGCKAPFAYQDHFEVVSCHDGTKTIYRMSKSSGAVMGKPSITPIVSIPTTETGITVTIAVKNEGDGRDRIRFQSLIKQIVAQGEMKVNLNGSLLPVLPFSEAKHGYLIMPREQFDIDGTILVRYGNVVYPIPSNPAYEGLYDSAKTFLRKMMPQNSYSQVNHWSIVLQAEPNTISVTPSRESLSMSAHTIETVESLLEKFQKNTYSSQVLHDECRRLNFKSIEETPLMGKPIDLMTLGTHSTCVRSIELRTKDYITDIVDAAGHRMRHNYPADWKGFHEKSIKARLNALASSGFGKRGLIQSFKAEMFGKTLKRRTGRTVFPWFQRRVIWPVLREMENEPLLSSKNFGVWDNKRMDRNWSYASRNSSRTYDFIRYDHFVPTSVEGLLPYVRGVVLLAHSRLALDERASLMPEFKHWFGIHSSNLAYLVPRNDKKVVAAKAFFERLGFYVVDITARQSWEDPEEVVTEDRISAVASVPVIKKKKPVGFPLLSELGSTLSIESLHAETSARTTTPGYIVRLSPNLQSVRELDPHYLNDELTIRAFVSLFGSQGAVAANAVQNQKALDEGALPVIPWMVKKLLEGYETIPEIEQYYRNSIDHVRGVDDYRLSSDERDIFNFIRGDEVFSKHFGVGYRPNQEVKNYLILKDVFPSYLSKDQHPEIHKLFALVASWTPNDKVTKLVNMLQDNELVRFLNDTQLKYNFRNQPEDVRKKVRAIVLTVLKG